jgi:hypothetical protein
MCILCFSLFLFLHFLGSNGTGDNLDQLSGNDSLSGAVVQDLVLANHLTGVLGSVLRDFSLASLEKAVD